MDGCKLPSNASKEWSGKISDLVRKKEKMEKRVTELLRRQEGRGVFGLSSRNMHFDNPVAMVKISLVNCNQYAK